MNSSSSTPLDMSPTAERLIAEIEAKIAKRKAQGSEPEPTSVDIGSPTPPRPWPRLATRQGRVVAGWAEFTVDPAYEREWHLREQARIDGPRRRGDCHQA
jgi:hypothetical protein